MNKEIEQLNFNNIYEFCEYALEVHDKICDCDDTDNNITFIAKYAEAREIINYMVAEGYDLRFADFSEPEDSTHGYQDEFYVMICRNELFVEPAKVDEKYMNCEDGVVFLIEGVNSAILPHIKSPFVYDVAFVNSEDNKIECSGDCERCEFSHDEEYFINGAPSTKEEFEEARLEVLNRFEEFDEAFTDMIQAGLIFQCSYRDLFNDLLRDYCETE